MARNEHEDELGIDIDVWIKNGEVFQVDYKGQAVRARVNDFDVQFPCIANSLKRDADNELYMEIVV